MSRRKARNPQPHKPHRFEFELIRSVRDSVSEKESGKAHSRTCHDYRQSSFVWVSDSSSSQYYSQYCEDDESDTHSTSQTVVLPKQQVLWEHSLIIHNTQSMKRLWVTKETSIKGTLPVISFGLVNSEWFLIANFEKYSSKCVNSQFISFFIKMCILYWWVLVSTSHIENSSTWH